jgi:two-component system, LytTR family, response regulator AlgR
MKVLIVDDETPARVRLSHLVGSIDGVEVCGEAADGGVALERVQRLAPDVVLMDIRMPGMDGLEAARHLSALEAPPAVIFTTAFDEYAVEAFEACAVDYLLKPIRAERLAEALSNTRRLTRAQILRLPDTGPRRHIAARTGQRLDLIPLSEIRLFRAEHKYVVVYSADRSVLIEDSLKSLEDEFGDQFLRVHRNALVAERHIRAMERSSDGWMLQVDSLDEPIPVSRRHLTAARRRLKGEADT